MCVRGGGPKSIGEGRRTISFNIFLFLLSSRELSEELARKMQVFSSELVSDSCGFPHNSRVTGLTFTRKICDFHKVNLKNRVLVL